MLRPHDFFDLSDNLTSTLFNGCEFVWQAVGMLSKNVDSMLQGEKRIFGEVMKGVHLSDRSVYIGKDAIIEPGAYILGPAYIGDGAIVRHGAFVRENVVMLPGSVLGHACEAKNSILLSQAHAAHFNYIGDSILGHNCNLGAGTKLSNLTLVSKKDKDTGKRPTIKLSVEGTIVDTNLAKLGAIVGDNVQTGCNAVLNPGCLVGPNTLIYANLSLRKGYYPPNSIIKLRQSTEDARIT